MDNEACQNEDRQLWQESDENGHRSLHVTKGGGIGINVGGTVWVMPLTKWHKLAVDSEAPTTENKGGDMLRGERPMNKTDNLTNLISELEAWFSNQTMDMAWTKRFYEIIVRAKSSVGNEAPTFQDGGR